MEASVSEEVKAFFGEMKTKHNYTYGVFTFSGDMKTIIVENKVVSSTYDEFFSKLPANDARFYVYDFKYEMDSGETREKLVFIQWCPDTTPTKKKMILASSKDNLKAALNGLQVLIEANKASELAEDVVLQRVKSSRE